MIAEPLRAWVISFVRSGSSPFVMALGLGFARREPSTGSARRGEPTRRQAGRAIIRQPDRGPRAEPDRKLTKHTHLVQTMRTDETPRARVDCRYVRFILLVRPAARQL